MTTKTETREVTMKELAQAFSGKYVDATCAHCCGIVIGICGGVIDYEDLHNPKLCITSGDAHNNQMGTICMWANSIEKIEEKDGTYSIITGYMPKIEISEHTSNEE